MQPILIKQKYKVTHIVHVEENYAAFQAVDIESREKTEYLLNVYEGELIKRYIGSYSSLRHCDEFVDMFTCEGMLVAVFTFREGRRIDDVFYKGAEVDWQSRMHYAQLLFHLGLRAYGYPPEISCAALLSSNLVLIPKSDALAVNYVVRPLNGMNERELTFLVSDQVKKVLLKRFSSPDAEIALLKALEQGRFPNAKELYTYWVRVRGELQAEYEKIYGKGSVGRGLYLLFMNVKRWFKGAFGKKG